jgi:hypothetical protein
MPWPTKPVQRRKESVVQTGTLKEQFSLVEKELTAEE